LSTRWQSFSVGGLVAGAGRDYNHAEIAFYGKDDS
jgi:hypothetical protein